MSRKKRDARPFITREAAELKFYSERADTYLPRHSMVYSEEGLGNWVKDFNVAYELYLEENDVLRPMDYFVYRHLLSLADRGLCVCLKKFAWFLHVKPGTLIEHLDRLQDALLLYRVCRVDTQGRPNDFVLQSPLSRKAWQGPTDGRWETVGEKVIWRVQTQCTRIERQQMGSAWPGEEFKFSQRRISSAFKAPAFEGDKRTADARAEEFTVLVLDLLFQLNTKNWRGRDARQLFEEQLMKAAERKKIFIDEPKFLAALEIQKRYARELFKAA
jgi:hypothetical protein